MNHLRALSALSVLVLLLASPAAVGGGMSAQLAPAGVHTCPMHPDVRGKAGETCPRCAMKLIPLGVLDYDPYALEVITPHAPRAGVATRLRFRVRGPRGGAVASRFEAVHDRVLHLFVVSHDLNYFTHVHPTLDEDGTFEQPLTLPRGGAYRLIADFLPSGGLPQVLQKTLVTSGYEGPIAPPDGQAVDMADKIVNGARVKLIMEPPVGSREQIITFELSDAANGKPITDLEPFLAAQGHLLIVRGDLSAAEHSHPFADLSTALGPRVAFQVLFPREGVYRLWAQFQRRGVVMTARFTVNAAAAATTARR